MTAKIQRTQTHELKPDQNASRCVPSTLNINLAPPKFERLTRRRDCTSPSREYACSSVPRPLLPTRPSSSFERSYILHTCKVAILTHIDSIQSMLSQSVANSLPHLSSRRQKSKPAYPNFETPMTPRTQRVLLLFSSPQRHTPNPTSTAWRLA